MECNVCLFVPEKLGQLETLHQSRAVGGRAWGGAQLSEWDGTTGGTSRYTLYGELLVGIYTVRPIWRIPNVWRLRA